MSVLFEELRESHAEHVERAIPSLVKLLDEKEPLLRGEAVSILGIIGSDKALAYVRQRCDDPSPRVREVVELVLQERS